MLPTTTEPRELVGLYKTTVVDGDDVGEGDDIGLVCPVVGPAEAWGAACGLAELESLGEFIVVTLKGAKLITGDVALAELVFTVGIVL